MKKFILLTSLIAAAGMTNAAVQPVNTWSKFLTGKPGQDDCRAIVTDGANQVYWLAFEGSTTADRDVKFGDVVLYDGAKYDSTSANKNLTLLKTDAAGNEAWCLHSNYGDFLASGGLAVTSTGDVVFCGKVRHTEGYLDEPVSITDGKGKTVTLDWKVDKRYQRLYIAKCTSDGELLWIRTCDLETAMNINNKTFASDAINVNAIAVDKDDNIYVGGNNQATMTVEKKDGSVVTISAKNLASYDGGNQASAGSLYILKLDSDGYYVNNLAETGDEITESKILSLEYSDGKLYASGTVKSSKGTAKISIDGKELTPTAYPCPLVASFNTDLTANWVTMLPMTTDTNGSGCQTQNLATKYDNKYFWLTGTYNGKISDPANEANYVESTVKKNTREGFVIKLDAATGNWIKGVSSKGSFSETYLTGYIQPICPANEPDNLYVNGYCMNATVGSFLRCYDKETLEGIADSSWNIVKGGGAPTASACAYAPSTGKIFVSTRGNGIFEPLGGEKTEKPSGFTNLFSCFQMGEGFVSGINDINVDNEGQEEGITRYFTIDGVEVSAPTSGLYIRVRGNKADKVIF